MLRGPGFSSQHLTRATYIQIMLMHLTAALKETDEMISLNLWLLFWEAGIQWQHSSGYSDDYLDSIGALLASSHISDV